MSSQPTFLTVGERRLEYRWIGPRPHERPTLVFLHEGLGCVTLWKDFPDRLAESTGWGALVYSRLGYGASDPAPLPWPVSFMHEEARQALPAVLDAAEVERAVLVGHSDGGSIALIHAAVERTGPVQGVIAEAPHVFVEDVTLESIRRAAEAYMSGDLRRRLERYHGANVDIAFWGWNRVWLDPAFRGWSIQSLLPCIRVPVLVVQGEDDPYGTLSQLEAIESASGGPVEALVLPDCGHAPHAEAPRETLAAMTRFVAAHPAA